ncbi:HD domain-containing protein [Breznakiellaceae bacterium SP9]
MPDSICNVLQSKGYWAAHSGFSALDAYWNRLPLAPLSPLPYRWFATNANIVVLACLFDDVRFPGVEIADAALETAQGESCFFRCVEGAEAFQTFRLLDLNSTGTIVNWWRQISPNAEYYQSLMDAALVLSRYGSGNTSSTKVIAELLVLTNKLSVGITPKQETQRVFLSCLLLSPRPDRGLKLLQKSGFLAKLWPPLDALSKVDHAKEFHPEGNVWNHTLETFHYRKSIDLRLSLGLLLHDIGKPLAQSSGNLRFAAHAEIGAGLARRFLNQLGFASALIDDIYYLVKNHMLPAALKRLPLIRTEEIMKSPLFPTLMELYRCDESSSFKGLSGYYENSAAYQTYLKHSKNPYRSADGKKFTSRP